MSGVKRSQDSGRRDTKGRRIKVSGNAAQSRSTAPAPAEPATRPVDGPHDPYRVPAVSAEALARFRRSCAEDSTEPRHHHPTAVIPVRVGDSVVWDSPATPPEHYTVLDRRRERTVTGHDGTKVTWGETSRDEWLIQSDRGDLQWTTFDQRPWKNHTVMGLDREGAPRPRTVQPRCLLSATKDLTAAHWQPVEPHRAELLGVAADGYQVIESHKGGMSYVRDTGRTLPANRLRPAVAVFDRFTVDTYGGEVEGRPSVLGRPGEPLGELYVPISNTGRDAN